MRHINMLFVFILLSFYLTAYATDQPVKAPAVYTEESSGIAVTADSSQFIIKLKANPTTGYAWFLREYDDRLLTPVKYEFTAAQNKLVGAPGIAVWTFKAKKPAFVVPQQTVLRFVYARPWEGDDQSKQIAFRVNIVNQ